MTKKTTVKTKSQPKPDDKEQSARFITTAIARGADRMSTPADKLLGRLAKMPPEPKKRSDKKRG
jgi:hypothetical protein